MNRRPTPNEQGARTEAAVASALVRAGARVFVPVFGSDGRVDLIYDKGDGLIRVQCKTARRLGDSLRFWTCSNTDNSPLTYVGEVDEFGVYSRETEVVYLVPLAEVPTRACTLRIAPTLNGQALRVRWASEFELGPP